MAQMQRPPFGGHHTPLPGQNQNVCSDDAANSAPESTPLIARYAARYCALGLGLVPLLPASKVPIRVAWNHHDNTIRNTVTAQLHWTRHPDHNMGALHDASRT